MRGSKKPREQWGRSGLARILKRWFKKRKFCGWERSLSKENQKVSKRGAKASKRQMLNRGRGSL